MLLGSRWETTKRKLSLTKRKHNKQINEPMKKASIQQNANVEEKEGEINTKHGPQRILNFEEIITV